MKVQDIEAMKQIENIGETILLGGAKRELNVFCRTKKNIDKIVDILASFL